MYNKGEIWFVEFPLEEDNSQTINRPVIVLDENTLGVLSVKITKHSPRKEDPYDTPILYWQEANLRLASTARVSKVYLASVYRGKHASSHDIFPIFSVVLIWCTFLYTDATFTG